MLFGQLPVILYEDVAQKEGNRLFPRELVVLLCDRLEIEGDGNLTKSIFVDI